MDKRELSSVVAVILALTAVMALSAGVAAGADARSDRPQTGDGGIVGVSQTHSAGSTSNTTYVWEHTAQGEDVSAYLISVQTDAGSDAELCLRTNGSGTCLPLSNSSSLTFTVPSNASDGETNLTLLLRDTETDETLDSRTLTRQPIPRSGDLDSDGLNNGNEATEGTNVTDADTDGDGLADGPEVHDYGTSPVAADTDGDGLSDGRELDVGTDPTTADTDGDGVADGRELDAGTDPTTADTDGDGLSDERELDAGTDPTTADTDGDGVADGVEIEKGTNPLVADTDGDGLSDSREIEVGTDPAVADTDGDGLSDSREIEVGTDPAVADTDGDGLSDSREIEVGTDPAVADTDGDGLSDGREVEEGTDPTNADTDGDLMGDKLEVSLGTNPTDELTPAWLTSTVLGFVVGLGLSVTAIRSGRVIDIVDRARTLQYRLVRTEADTLDAPVDDGESEPVADSAATVIEDADDLLADDELVTEMLRAEAGRMKQSEIVDATDWSKAKVSRLLTRMDEEDAVVKLRLGRENLICLERPESAQLRPDGDDRSDPLGPGTGVC